MHAHAFLMVGGTTSAVQSMILSATRRGGKDHPAEKCTPQRDGSHGAVRSDSRLCKSGCECSRLGIPLGMSVDAVKKAIQENPDAKAVFVNNPTYYGICSDFRAIVKLAHANRYAGVW